MTSTPPTALTGQDIIDRFEAIVDDSIDEDQELFLMNAAKDEIEGSYDWNFNRALDSSVTIGSSDNYLTTHALQTDFLVPRKLYITGDINPWILIGYDQRDRYKDIYKRFYIDWLNRTFALCGASNGAGKVINLFYGRMTPDLTLTTSPVWPSVFHKYLPFKMAEMWQSGSDGDEVNQRMSPQNRRLADNLLASFIAWDRRIKTIEYNAKNERNVDLGTYPDVVGNDFL